MHPDVQVVEQTRDNRRGRREPQRGRPDKKEAENVHPVARKPEDAPVHEGPRPVIRIEVVDPEGALETEIALHGVEQVQGGTKNDGPEQVEKDGIRREGVPVRNREDKDNEDPRDAKNRKTRGIHIEPEAAEQPGEQSAVQLEAPAEPDVGLVSDGNGDGGPEPHRGRGSPHPAGAEAVNAARHRRSGKEDGKKQRVKPLPFKNQPDSGHAVFPPLCTSSHLLSR